MIADASPFLSPWSNFYVIVGSSAGALTGLQFVVITLMASAGGLGSNLEVRAFGTPTVVHFCFALVISAIANAPWHSLSGAAIAFRVCGVVGAAYSLNVIRHARKQTHYSPDAEDWFWYAGLPLATYAALLIAAIVFDARRRAVRDRRNLAGAVIHRHSQCVGHHDLRCVEAKRTGQARSRWGEG